MGDPIFQDEPMRPSERADAEVRASLAEAFRAERKLMEAVSKTEGLIASERKAAKMIGVALKNIEKRWLKGVKIDWNADTFELDFSYPQRDKPE